MSSRVNTRYHKRGVCTSLWLIIITSVICIIYGLSECAECTYCHSGSCSLSLYSTTRTVSNPALVGCTYQWTYNNDNKFYYYTLDHNDGRNCSTYWNAVDNTPLGPGETFACFENDRGVDDYYAGDWDKRSPWDKCPGLFVSFVALTTLFIIIGFMRCMRKPLCCLFGDTTH